MLLQAKHLKKTYYTRNGALEILKNVSLDVKENEVIMIGGPSGSGKTTLFQILSGLDNEYEGEIMLEENRYHDMKKRDRRKLRLQKFSYIFQDYCLMPTLNVYDNVIFQALAAKKKIEKDFVEELLQKLGIWERRKHHPSQLSGGEQQRVAIARAMANKPLVLFADEPTGNLDYDNSMKVMEMLLDSARFTSAAVLVVTHDESLFSMSDRHAKIEKGELIFAQ